MLSAGTTFHLTFLGAENFKGFFTGLGNSASFNGMGTDRLENQHPQKNKQAKKTNSGLRVISVYFGRNKYNEK